MAKTMGIGCIVLGILCLLAAVGFVVYNNLEETTGQQASRILLQDVQLCMEENETASTEETQQPSQEGNAFSELLSEPQVPEMLTVTVAEGECIGILSIPVLELELPVLTDWSYEKLRKAPCHYFGSCYEPNFVIAAHNYRSHFGRLTQLLPGDLVLFTDVTGQTHCYEVSVLPFPSVYSYRMGYLYGC